MKKVNKILYYLGIVLIMIKSAFYNIWVFEYISIGGLLITINSLLTECFKKI